MPISEPPCGQALAEEQDQEERQRRDERDDPGVGGAWRHQPFIEVDLVEVDRCGGCGRWQHDREADADLGGGHGDDEQGEHLTRRPSRSWRRTPRG